MLSLDLEQNTVLQVSANIEQWLEVSVEQALQMTPVSLLGDPLIKRVRQGLQHKERLQGRVSLTRQRGGRRCRFSGIVYRHRQRVVVELEQIAGMSERRLLPAVNEWLNGLAETNTEEALLQLLVTAVRSLTGHDRVMVYQFDADWNGTVVAESRSQAAESYLGHSFPASDIPPQVRAKYQKNTVRSIPDATADRVPLVPAQDARDPTPLDLSLGILRAVAPSHLDYTRNMGVKATLSVAMQDQQHLWGLLACHGLEPAPLSPLVRDEVCTLVHMATQRLFLLKARAETLYLQRVHDCRERLAEAQMNLLDPGLLLLQSQEWLELFNASGLALLKNGAAYSIGQALPQAELLKIGAWLSQHHNSTGVWSSQHLAGTPLAAACDLGEVCGLLAVPLPVDAIPQNWLLLLRGERLKSYRWAGWLQAQSYYDQGRYQLSAKRSFDAWVELVRDQSEPWLPHEQKAAQDIGDDLRVTILMRAISTLNERLTKANRSLEELACTDALTQVWNRYRIEQAIERDIQLGEQLGQPSVLLLLDVDFFKSINDQYGHEVGDAVLVTLADILRHSLRETDSLGRWGGEEFVILASGCSLSDGQALAERIRTAVSDMQFDQAGTVTLSIGVSQWQPGDQRSQWVDRADQAMYAAKQGGRNRVVIEAALDV
ncbi:hypothetical protein GCM10011502_08890 [Oceanisphaera marina]|uniref:diguanylate cyclase n=1 Tax=Oceanisphaera marina TaxID=2017550 RepID=A0ABQ1IGB6_9GAMM|nr:hypothetical protein GCM10011502_08890 [Oceanisphaera marina]